MKANNQLHLDMLLQSIQLLAAPYEQQVRALPNFVHVPDEIALTFNDTYVFVDDLKKEGLITAAQEVKLEQMDVLLDQMGQDEDIWTCEALQVSPQWEEMRKLATSILASFRASKQFPDLFWLQYIPDEKAHA